MAYTKTNWKDRAVERPRTYRMQNNPDGTVTLIPMPGTVYEPGTPVNAPNLNKIEQGIANALPLTGGTIANNSSTPLVLKTGNVGWGYIPLFTDRDDQNRRTGYWGFPGGVGTEDHMTLKNERSGNLNLSTTGSGKVLANGKEIWDSGNFDPNSKMNAQNRTIKVSGNYAGYEADATSGSAPEFIGLIEGIRRGLIQLGDNIEIRRYAENGSTITNRVRITDTDLTVNGQSVYHAGNTPQTRLNNGVFEVNNGGSWIPVGGIKRVQRGSATAGATGNIDIAITSVNTAKAFVNLNTIYNQYHSDQVGTKTISAALTSATNLRIFVTSDGSSISVPIQWEVVESY